MIWLRQVNRCDSDTNRYTISIVTKMNRLIMLSRHYCSQPKIPTIEEVKQHWNFSSQHYDSFAYCPQTFYYSLSNMMKLNEAENILEVACGSGTLLPLILQHKRPETYYLATDLSSNMVELARHNLKKHFEKYKSQLTFDQWIKGQNLEISVADAQLPINTDRKFDRIICNLGLMLTPDPKKILNNLYAHAKPGCLFGLSIWGNKEQMTMISAIQKAMKQCGIDPPAERSNFHLYQKVPALAQQSGWQVMVSWQQNAPFPIIDQESLKQNQLYEMQLKKLSEQKKAEVKTKIYENVSEMLKNKSVMNFATEVMILKRKE